MARIVAVLFSVVLFLAFAILVEARNEMSYGNNDIYGFMSQKVEKGELFLFKAGVTHYELRLLPEGVMLLYLEPDRWQGNSDVYPLAGGRKVGHHHSQLELLGTTHPPQSLINFKVLRDKGRIVAYSGKWGFGDYFVSAAVHYIWVEDGLLYRYVKTNLTVLKDFNDPVEAVWVALANDPDYYTWAIANTTEGMIIYDMRGTTGHALKEYTLGSYGWVALINPLSKDVRGSVALVLVRSSHKAHPTVYSGPNVDNIEIHLLGKGEKRILRRGDSFELHYLLIVSNEPNSYSWISGAVERAKPVVELIDSGELEKPPEILRFSPAEDLQGSGINVDDPDSPTGKAKYAAAGLYFKEAIVFGPYITLQAGSYVVRFLLKIDGTTASRVATIDVCTGLGKTVIVSRDIWGPEFKEIGKYQWFTLNFVLNKTVPNIEFRVWYRPEGRTNLYVGQIEVLAAITAENIVTREATVVVEKTVTKTVTIATGTMDSITMLIIASLTAVIFTLLVVLVRIKPVKRQSLQQTISSEVLKKAKLVELERLRLEGRISEEVYKRIKEELED